MALFGDKNKQTIEELENYYSNKEQKTGMAWVMAFLSLLLTATVLGGLFFGGRAIYRALSDDGTNETAVTDTTSTDSNTAQPTPASDSPAAPSPAPTPPPSPAPASSGSGVVSDQAASTTTPSNSGNSGAQTAQGGEGSTNASRGTNSNSSSSSATVAGRSTNLPNTGSGYILFTAPAIALISGYFLARKKTIQKLKNQ